MAVAYAQTSPASARQACTPQRATTASITLSATRPCRCEPGAMSNGALSAGTSSRWIRSVTMRAITAKGGSTCCNLALRLHAETGGVVPRAHDDRAVLMPAERPVSGGGFIEEDRAHRAPCRPPGKAGVQYRAARCWTPAFAGVEVGKNGLNRVGVEDVVERGGVVKPHTGAIRSDILGERPQLDQNRKGGARVEHRPICFEPQGRHGTEFRVVGRRCSGVGRL